MENKQKNHFMVDLVELGDDRGGLVVIEEGKNFPFPIKRVFYEYNTDPSIARGNHANLNSRFGFVSITGACVVEVNDGYESKEYLLDSPQKFLFVDKMLWKVMKEFSTDNVLLVLSDQLYDGQEYIRDFDEFITMVKKHDSLCK